MSDLPCPSEPVIGPDGGNCTVCPAGAACRQNPARSPIVAGPASAPGHEPASQTTPTFRYDPAEPVTPVAGAGRAGHPPPDTAARPAFLAGVTARQYPFTSRFFDRGQGIRLHYLDEGRGDPLVFVHGNPTWSWFWRRPIANLRHDWRCVAIDHVGCGLSDKPDATRYSYRFADRIDDLDRLLDHLGIDRGVTLVVHDWGGAIGMGWATRYPARVRRLVICNTAAFRLPATRAFPWPLRLFRDLPVSELLARGLNAFAIAAAITCARKPLPAAVRRGYLGPYGSWADRIAIHRFVADIPLGPRDPSWPELLRIESNLDRFVDTPTLICWGQHDFIFDHHFLAEWRRRLPGAEVHIFSEAGHYLPEDAAPRLIRLMRDFLRRNQ